MGEIHLSALFREKLIINLGGCRCGALFVMEEAVQHMHTAAVARGCARAPSASS